MNELMFPIWDLEGFAEPGLVSSMWDDSPPFLWAVAVERGEEFHGVGWPAIISGPPNLGPSGLVYRWRWAVTASVQYLNPSRSRLRALMKGPDGHVSKTGTISWKGQDVPSRVLSLGVDATVTIPDCPDLAFLILARANDVAFSVTDRSTHWWPQVLEQSGRWRAQ